MNSLRIVTMSPEQLTQEFVFECHNEKTAQEIIQGTSEACKVSGWTIKEFQLG